MPHRLSSQNTELRNSPCKGGEEAATFPCTQPSCLQCQEQRWHPCTTTLELGQEEHPLTPQQWDVQPKRRVALKTPNLALAPGSETLNPVYPCYPPPSS